MKLIDDKKVSTQLDEMRRLMERLVGACCTDSAEEVLQVVKYMGEVGESLSSAASVHLPTPIVGPKGS